MGRQETLSFRPRRSPCQGPHGATPYDRPARGDDAAANIAFNVGDMEQESVPGDWCFKPETGYFERRKGARVCDFWELKAGCPLRYHCHQPRTLFDPAGSSDIPVPLDKLDNVRVTIHFDPDRSAKTFTDDFRNPQHHDKDLPQHQLPSTWKGIRVFQSMLKPEKSSICFPATATTATRSECKEGRPRPQEPTSTTTTSRGHQNGQEQGRSGGKVLEPDRKRMFHHAKVKELRSFFECGVWEFSAAEEATPERTLTSRILLKCSRNADGSPRANARLVVHGFNDVGALIGNLKTR